MLRPMTAIDGTVQRGATRFVSGGTLRLPGGAVVPVRAEPLTIGRNPTADIVLEDAAVSALHCEVVATPRGVVVRDLDSTNGTIVGPSAVTEARLLAACTLKLGETTLLFEPSASPELVSHRDGGDHFGPLLGISPAMQELYKRLAKFAPTDLSLLITGETGTGKELAARAVHRASPRADKPFVVVDCGALPTGLAESVLFGHERGAFTGATERREGAFALARGGTLFLDELGELPDALQPKLLRAAAERTVKRVGGSSYEAIDVRIVSATRVDLRKAVNQQTFRDDLFFRLAQVRVELPPLRKRSEDIPRLVAKACEQLGRAEAAARVTEYIETRFARYDWPGNVRELINVASVLASIGDDDVDDLIPAATSGQGDERPFVDAKRTFEHDYFTSLLEATGGNISEISRRCGLARHQVRSHLRKLGLVQ